MGYQAESRQRGVALLMTMIALAILTVLGLAISTTGRIAFMINENEEEAIEAGYIAEAGLNHARELIIDMNTADYTTLLQSGADDTGCTGDELSAVADDPIPSAGYDFGGGSYVVSVCDDDDGDDDTDADSNGSVRVQSVGTGADGASATVELMLGTEDLPGFLVDGNLRINGNPTINGAGGSVHSNGDLMLVGNPCAQLHFSTGNLVDSNGDPIADPSVLGADTGANCNESGGDLDMRSDEDGISVPAMDFQALYDAVDYRLENDGTITDVATGLDVTGVLSEWGWDAGNVKWTLSGNSVTPGSYYAVESNVTISGSPGSQNNPTDFSLVTDGYIDMSGNPSFTPNLTVGGLLYSLVAGTDLGLSGNSGTAGSQGIHYAHHQVMFNGNLNLFGQVIVADDDDTPIYGNNNLAVLDGDGFMEVSGNATITYEGGGGFGGMAISGWREVRN